jgi:hypothetical protein
MTNMRPPQQGKAGRVAARRRWIDFDRRFRRRRCQSQELARSRDRLGAICAGEQAIVADAMEA